MRFGEGEKNLQWKGDKAGYGAMHGWMYRHFGRLQKCENCGSENDPEIIYDWANVSGKYLRQRNDWKRLCRQCHVKMDGIGFKKLTEKLRREIHRKITYNWANKIAGGILLKTSTLLTKVYE